MSTKKHIDWNVPSSDILVSPLGYKLELGETRNISPVLSTHSTFENTEEFQVSISGDGVFETYPFNGLLDATTQTVVRFLRNGESPLSTLAVGAGSFLYKMSLDCKEVIQYKQICELDTFLIDSISCDRDGNTWVKDTSGTITVLDRWFRTISTTRLDSATILAVADPNRMVFWQVMPDSVKMVRMDDLSVSFEVATPSSITAVIAYDFSAPSGNLFLVTTNGGSNTSIMVTPLGVLTNIGVDASGICQWGNKGALLCSTSDSKIYVFDGTSISDNFSTAGFGIGSPVRVASAGNIALFVSGDNGKFCKVGSGWDLMWNSPVFGLGYNVDLRVTPEMGSIGNVIYLASEYGVVSVRDMLDEGWLYGVTEMPLPVVSSLFPAISVMNTAQPSHIWARATAISSGIPPRENSSSSSSQSSSSRSSMSSMSSRSSRSSSSSKSSLSSQSSRSSESSQSSLSSLSSLSSESSQSSLSSLSSLSSMSSSSNSSSTQIMSSSSSSSSSFVAHYHDNGDGTVTDNFTGLMWAKNANLGSSTMLWQAAVDYCANLASIGYLGHYDWRLPSCGIHFSYGDTPEMDTLGWKNGIFGGEWQGLAGTPFTNIQTTYWTSYEYNYPGAAEAFVVNVTNGNVVDNFKLYSYHSVWPVRNA